MSRLCSCLFDCWLWAPDVSLIICHAARGAAYGVSQASPSGGINAVWVMPEAGGGFVAEDRTGNQRLSPSFRWSCCFYMTQYGKTMHIIYIYYIYIYLFIIIIYIYLLLLLLCLHTDRHAPSLHITSCNICNSCDSCIYMYLYIYIWCMIYVCNVM